ncbi:MAG: hypothetical protein MPF33_00160 [Candidatus Aramenus sp.]|jgi:hypothetical protein|nr:hypothetical protein [Candidatus Aramenus sp.]
MSFQLLESLAVVVVLGLTHGLDPDHVVMTRMLKRFSKVVSFALFHTTGFLVVALPLALVILSFSGAKGAIAIGSYAVGMIVSVVFLWASLVGREIEVEPKGLGLLQGALVLTSSKVVSLTIALASGELTYSVLILLAFVASSFASLLALSLVNLVPSRIERPFNLAVSLVSLGYIAYELSTSLGV